MRKVNLGILVLLIAATTCFGIFKTSPAWADFDIFKTAATIIDYTRNALGVLIGQVMYSLTSGVGVDGQAYTNSTAVGYDVIDGIAYTETTDSVTHVTAPDGRDFVQIDHITSSYIDTTDEDGNVLHVLCGATGTRTQKGWGPAADEDGDGEISDEEMLSRNYFVKTGDLTFEIINGAAEAVAWDYTETGWADEGMADEDISYYRDGKETYEYTVIHGVTKLTDSYDSGTTWFYGDGTLPEDIEGPVCPLDGKKLAFTTYSNHTHTAYDGDGNVIGTPGEIVFHRDDGGTPDDPDDDRVWVTINGTEVEGVADIEAYINEKGDFSYSVGYSCGVKASGDGWVSFNENSFTSYEVLNGALQADWTYIEYHNSPIQDSIPPPPADPPVSGTILTTLYCPGSATAQETTWLYVKDADGKIWALKFTGGLASQAHDYSVGDSISIVGDTIEGLMVHVTEIK